jgi:hypothetical protein
MVSSAVLEHSPFEEEVKNGQEMVAIKQSKSKHNFVQTIVEVTAILTFLSFAIAFIL